MKKQTLLEMVQRIAEYIDAGTVTSISDTRESMQIARIVKETYEDLLIRNEIRVEKNFYTLDSIIDPDSHPTYLKFKEPVININSIEYFNEATDNWTSLSYIEPEDFIRIQSNMNKTFDNTTGDPLFMDIVDYNGVKFRVRTNKHPSTFTILNDEYAVFDSFDKRFDDTIQESKVRVYGTFMPEFILEDDFIPNMNTIHFPLLLSLSKVNALMELKTESNPQEVNRARKQTIITSRIDRRIEGQDGTTWKNRKFYGRRFGRLYL